MWPFTKKSTLQRQGILNGFTDWHCHILPGVDDGVKKMQDALDILDDYARLGVERVWFTPHIMEDIPNTTAHLRQRFDELQEVYNGPLELNLAAENMLDNLFDERLNSNDLLPIGPEKRHLLVETSYYTPPYDLISILNRIKKAGYFPLLAHPERYGYMTDKDYDQLHEMGVLMQLNLTSLAGLYGPEPQNKAKKLLAKGYYHASGTDLHRRRTLVPAISASIPASAIGKVPTPSTL